MVPASGSLSSLTAAPGMHAEYLLSRHMTVHTRQTRQEGSGPGLLARAAALALAVATIALLVSWVVSVRFVPYLGYQLLPDFHRPGSPDDEDAVSDEPIASTIDLAADSPYRATGKRKTAVARVTLKPGTGVYTINGRAFDDAFPRETLRKNIIQPLEAVGFSDRRRSFPPRIAAMKVRNSLKSLRGRHRDNQIVRRKGRVYVINKTQKRYKARQG